MRVAGPDGRQSHHLSRACSWIWAREASNDKAKRWIRAFLLQVNSIHEGMCLKAVEEFDVADAYVDSVASCRDMQDRFVVVLRIKTSEATENHGSYWLKPKAGDYPISSYYSSTRDRAPRLPPSIGSGYQQRSPPRS